MKAIKNTEKGITVVDLPRPEGEGVRVKVRSAGICGSDLSLIKMGPLPMVLGHEIGGVLEDGTGVAIEPIIPCGRCDQCVVGDYNRCRDGLAADMGLGRDGGMVEEILVPERCLVRLPQGLTTADACLAEPLAVCLQGLHLAGLEPGQRVAVIGGGSIGLCALVAARAANCEVALVARHPHQISAGQKLGASELKGEYDLVVDCAGGEAALAQACEILRPRGTLLVLAVYPGTIPLPGYPVMFKELRIIGSFEYGTHAVGRIFDNAVAILAHNPRIVETLITHRFPLAEAAQAFEVAKDRKAGSIKVVLEP
ncbi:MAG: alcohol dehydrogenase catalytic domain-containing protein [Proteobacteria bacterium]|nr:alcohol dehydrogenase catalytic domain-containing protein [Pseudomonadota bacterium]